MKLQSIDGFGVATAWGSVPSSATMDAFFSTTKGAGLSIVRNRIPFREAPAAGLDDKFMGGGNYTFTTVNPGTDKQYKNFTLNWSNWDLATTHGLIQAIKTHPDYQVASYFSTPWTPPNNSTSKWKLGVVDYVNNPQVGGYLDPSHYADYADVLADYALGFEANMGAPLTAISLQNEPNFKVDYESADWSAAQFHDFIVVLAAEFTKKGVFTTLPNLKVMAPEDPNFKEDLILPTLADSATAKVIGIVGAHQYEFGPWNVDTYAPLPFAKSLAAGKRVWMTEWSTAAFGDMNSLDACLKLAKVMHQDFTAASLNAFVYWWSGALANDAGPSKTLWTLGQFSRFIRPGWTRVDAPTTPVTDVLLSAFRDAAGTKAAIVAINTGAAPQTFVLELGAGKFGAVTPYRTSATENLVALDSIPGGSTKVTVTVPAQSVTTFAAPITP